jgi:hypothetical protein
MSVERMQSVEGKLTILTIDKLMGSEHVRYRFRIFFKEDETIMRSGFFKDVIDCISLGKYLYLYYEEFSKLPPEYEEFKR